MGALLLALVAAAAALQSFPRRAGGPITQSAVGVAVEGQPAVVAVAGDRLVAYRASGAMVSGFPASPGRG